MNGPQHYREAERLLRRRLDDDLRAAQVHATLAAAAVTMDASMTYSGHITYQERERLTNAWRDVLDQTEDVQDD